MAWSRRKIAGLEMQSSARAIQVRSEAVCVCVCVVVVGARRVGVSMLFLPLFELAA